jgi:hypothetical protein
LYGTVKYVAVACPEEVCGQRQDRNLDLPDQSGLKEALRAAACEHRPIANVVEVLTRGYCERNGITIPGRDDLLRDGDKD